MLNGAQILLEVLKEQNVDTIFGYPGGFVLNIYDEIYKASGWLKHVITCHEQGAAHAADGYARATGKTGVVIATSGPGATNLVTGIANAYLDSTPMVAITGNVPLSMIGRDSFQEVDIKGITMPITKHNYMVKDVHQLAAVVREAFYIASSGRKGPVLIDIPKDVQLAHSPFTSLPSQQPQATLKPVPAMLEKALELIKESKRPFIYAGGGVVSTDSGADLIRFAETLHAPVGTSMMGRSAVPQSHPQMLGMTGMHGNYAATKAMAMSDLVIAVGARFSDRATGDKSAFSKNRKVLHIDIDPAEIGKNIPAYVSMVADVKEALKALNNAHLKACDPAWMEQVHALIQSPDNTVVMNQDVLNPYAVIQGVAARVPKDARIATDVGQHQMWTAQFYPFETPRTFITSGGLGTMGFGMGAAIGACMGSGKKTVLFTSDGSFHMNMNELATAVSNRLPLIVIVLNNNVLGMVRQWQTMFFGQRYSATTLDRATDYVKLADAFGAKGFRVENLSQLNPVLDEALALNEPVVVDVHIDRDEMVFPMIPPNGTFDDMIVRG